MKLRYKITGGILILLAIAITFLALTLSHNSACPPPPVAAVKTAPMKAVVYRCYGSPDVLHLEDVEKPTPAEDQVLVKVRAASVNPYDWHFMRGSPYLMRLESGLGAPDDIRMGVDFAGTVEAVGKDVQRFQPGDAVFGGTGGAFAEYVTVRADRALATKPANMTFAQAAAVPIAGITALQAVRDKGQVKPGQSVLINGASGGVGTFAVQIAKSYGAEVTGVCSTRNADMVRSIGADHVIDYSKEDYTKNEQHYDLIIDNVGNHSPSANRRVLKPEGILVIIGASKGNWLGPFMNAIEATVLSPFVEQDLSMMLARMRKDDLQVLGDLMQDGKVTPVIDRHYPFGNVAAAVRYLEEGHARGKVILDLE